MPGRFGTFKGVFVPSTEAILGNVLFLLLPVLTADVGLLAILIIIILAHSLTLSTSFSLADCATNLNEIGGGGMYALTKLSLGNAFGGSIGVQLYLAQAASIGFYCIGFTEPLQPILAPFLQKIPFLAIETAQDLLFQKQIISSLVFIIFFIIVMAGADFTLKIQMLILYILLLSILSIFFSPLYDIHYEGVAIYTDEINLIGNRPLTISLFFIAFTQFFPAVTGIDAGVGMSGELKDPKKNIVRGTFLAIIVTFTVYIIAAVIFSFIRIDALIESYNGENAVGRVLTNILGFNLSFPKNIPGILILAGILFATSSSALSFFMTAPRTARSLQNDNILPKFFDFLGKDIRKDGIEPRLATILTFFIGISIIWIGNINVAAMIVGISFLIVYGWINLSAFFERVSRNPTFRPSSKNHWAISLYGFLASMIAIALFDLLAGVLIFVTQYIIFRLILKYKSENKLEGVWWGVLFMFITRGLISLKKIVQGTKNWRPILSAFSFGGAEDNPEKIAEIASKIAFYKGIVHMNVLCKSKDPCGFSRIQNYKIPLSIVRTENYTESFLSILQASNFSGLDPNTILFEYKKKTNTVKIINTILEMNRNVLLLKNGNKLNKTELIDIWWRGERNGNLMVLLAYIIKTSPGDHLKNFRIRIIRKLDQGEDKKQAHLEMKELLQKTRLSGDVFIIPYDTEPFRKTLLDISADADLIMMGLFGNYTEKGVNRTFSLNEYFFDKEISTYNELPSVLFVKSAYILNLIEE
jgi:amino acid transporter